MHMRDKRIYLIALVAACAIAIVWSVNTVNGNHMRARSSTLVFGDEFNTSQLDRSKWTTLYWHGRTNPPELQYYADDAFILRNGVLRIRADKVRPTSPVTASAYLPAIEMDQDAPPEASTPRPYTSGLISSEDTFLFQYGYVEMRAKVPRGKGLWSAFWLLTKGTTLRPEIDVMELLGHETNKIYMTMHYLDSANQHEKQGASFKGPDFSADFHVFGVAWSPSSVIWYVDGVERFRVTDNIPDEPMYVLVNLAVGGDWPGAPDSTTQFPAYYDVDYIRVYQNAVR